jgi:RNA polymerase-binding transcription factor DksA
MKATNKPRLSAKVPSPAKSKPKSKRPASRTEDILGRKASPVRRPDIKAQWARNYRVLLQLRNRLLVQAGKLAKQVTEEIPTFSMHMADAGTDSFDRDFALSMLSSDQDALYEVEQAIRRIETGTYGRCELTHKIIPKSRLEAIPWTRFSAEAQLQLERDGALRQRKLSAASSLPAVDTGETESSEEGAAEPGERE